MEQAQAPAQANLVCWFLQMIAPETADEAEAVAAIVIEMAVSADRAAAQAAEAAQTASASSDEVRFLARPRAVRI